MNIKHTQSDLPFGVVQGVASGNVPAYCSDYDTVDAKLLPNRSSFRHYHNGIYTGYKWQCVEFARRWLLINTGCVFDDVAMAYDIFTLSSLKQVSDGQRLPLKSFKNGCQKLPQIGCLLIWQEGGEFSFTGHVAVVVNVTKDNVYVAEQNASFSAWPEGANYARSLPMNIDNDGNVWIEENEHGTPVLGWMIQTSDDSFAEPLVPFIPSKMQLIAHQAAKDLDGEDWLDENNPAEHAYVTMMNGHKMIAKGDPSCYFTISETAKKALKRATSELHAQFMFAIDHVLQHQELWPLFNIPEPVWPKIQNSWNNRRNEVMTGRFDFCLSERGLKLYEYNADSASCYLETGRIQGKWAQAHDIDLGSDCGEHLLSALVSAWQNISSDVVEQAEEPLHIHILYDRDLEEGYHALFMREAMEQAGIIVHMQRGFEGLSFNQQGKVIDAKGRPLTRVWKTWAWETALDQLRDELTQAMESKTTTPKLVDILLQEDVMVHEPLWTLLPSNKAILSVLWQLFPDSPYLLETTYNLTESLIQQGYVSKPIAGRCGANIIMVDGDDQRMADTDGNFAKQDRVFQALFPLPIVAENFVQVSSFCVNGIMQGLSTRVDEQAIITSSSDIFPLRVVSDAQHDGFVIDKIKNN